MAAARSTTALTAGSANSVNRPAVGRPGMSTLAGTIAASAAATHPAITTAAITTAVTDQGSRRVPGSAVVGCWSIRSLGVTSPASGDVHFGTDSRYVAGAGLRFPRPRVDHDDVGS